MFVSRLRAVTGPHMQRVPLPCGLGGRAQFTFDRQQAESAGDKCIAVSGLGGPAYTCEGDVLIAALSAKGIVVNVRVQHIADLAAGHLSADVAETKALMRYVLSKF